MDAIHLTHVQLAKVEPGSLVLIGPTGADAEQYFAIAVRQAGESFATGLVSFRADRGALRAVRTDLSVAETPERFVLSLGRHFTVEPNLFEQVRTDSHEQSALKAGDLLIHDALHLLVVAPAKDTPPLVVDLAGGEVTELPAASDRHNTAVRRAPPPLPQPRNQGEENRARRRPPAPHAAHLLHA